VGQKTPPKAAFPEPTARFRSAVPDRPGSCNSRGSGTQKHAYLIAAHNNFYNLEKLILLLDDKRNDIYIHVDKKVKSFDFARFSTLATKSSVFFTPRIKVYWGCYSQVRYILILLKAAVETGYRYYHLLSGADLPIKTQDEIHAFFKRKDGREFVKFSREGTWSIRRVALYSIFTNAWHGKGLPSVAGRFVSRCFRVAQIALGVNRLARRPQVIKKGADWFSITHELARFVLSSTEKVAFFRHSAAPSEHFLHTLVFNSPFYDRLHSQIEKDPNAHMRLIDWNRPEGGGPHIFRQADFECIMGSEMLFARKFDENVDRAIIGRIFEAVAARQRRSEEEKAEAKAKGKVEV